MNYGEEIKEIGEDILKEWSLRITPDETLAVIDEFVHTAVDLDMTGKEKFEWVVEKVGEMALNLIEFILPLIVQALYDLMMGRIQGAGYGR